MEDQAKKKRKVASSPTGKKRKGEEEEEGDVASKLWQALFSIKRSGGFCFGHKIEAPVLPGIKIPNHPSLPGTIALPLKPDQIEHVTKICSLAPFGRKDQTIYDTSVRNTWQLEPKQFKILNEDWNQMIENVLPRLKAELGLPKDVEVSFELYKMLLYEEGNVMNHSTSGLTI